ncbi:MAG: tryptophan-rich sensory protein [Clostridia bacterium]
MKQKINYDLKGDSIVKISENKHICRIIVVATFFAMVAVNALANILPINGEGTGGISDSYPNLFAPAGITFSIWGLIYLLLGAYAIYQTGLFKKQKPGLDKEWIEKTGFLFVLSSVANAVWIFAWHYRMIELSLLLMLVILASLIKINIIIGMEKLSGKEKIFIRLPFSVYFGWITVATIANVTTQLVDWNLNPFGTWEILITVAVLAVGIFIGISTMARNRDIPYGMVIIWAYAGILIKHVSENGFNGEYPAIIIAVVASLVLLAAAMAYILPKTLKRGKNL